MHQRGSRSDRDRGQKMIKTMPRRGYRFVAQVLQQSADPINASLFRSADLRPAPTPGLSSLHRLHRPSIAVLPFVNLSGDSATGIFQRCITEDINHELSRFSELSVIARNSTFQFQGQSV